MREGQVENALDQGERAQRVQEGAHLSGPGDPAYDALRKSIAVATVGTLEDEEGVLRTSSESSGTELPPGFTAKKLHKDKISTTDRCLIEEGWVCVGVYTMGNPLMAIHEEQITSDGRFDISFSYVEGNLISYDRLWVKKKVDT